MRHLALEMFSSFWLGAKFFPLALCDNNPSKIPTRIYFAVTIRKQKQKLKHKIDNKRFAIDAFFGSKYITGHPQASTTPTSFVV